MSDVLTVEMLDDMERRIEDDAVASLITPKLYHSLIAAARKGLEAERNSGLRDTWFPALSECETVGAVCLELRHFGGSGCTAAGLSPFNLCHRAAALIERQAAEIESLRAGNAGKFDQACGWRDLANERQAEIARLREALELIGGLPGIASGNHAQRIARAALASEGK